MGPFLKKKPLTNAAKTQKSSGASTTNAGSSSAGASKAAVGAARSGSDNASTTSRNQSPRPTGSMTTHTQPHDPNMIITDFNLVSGGSPLLHHVMRIPQPKHDLPNLTLPLKMFRQIPEEPTVATEELNGKEKLDPTKVGGKGSGRNSAFKKRSRQFTLGSYNGEDPLKQKRFVDPDRFPWGIKDFDGKNELTGNAESNNAHYALLIVPMGDELGDKAPGFLVEPVVNQYRFIGKPPFVPKTTEEAEEEMKKKAKSDKSLQRKSELSAAELSEKVDNVKLDAKTMEIYNRQQKKLQLKVSNDVGVTQRGIRRFAENQDGEEELDFEEVVSDDENIEFGIEDEQEAKQAKDREFGRKINRANFDDLEENDDDPTQRRKKNDKKIKKVLKKLEGENIYVSDDEDLDDEDEEEEKEKKDDDIFDMIQKDKEKADVKVKEEPVVREGSPSLLSLKREGSSSPQVTAKRARKEGSPNVKPPTKPGSPNLPSSKLGSPNLGAGSKPGSPNIVAGKKAANASSTTGSPNVGAKGDMERKRKADDPSAGEPKKIKLKLGGGSPSLPPAPPSAAEVIAKQKEEEKKRTVKKAGSPNLSEGKTSPTPRPMKPRAAGNSPALNSGNSPALPGMTPSLAAIRAPSPSLAGGADNGDLLTDSDVVEAFDSPNPPQTVKDIVTHFKDRIAKNVANKDRIRDILKRLCTVKDGVVRLK